MGIANVTSYLEIDHRQYPVIKPVQNLQSALFFEQKVVSGYNPTQMIFKITPHAPVYTQHGNPRMVFRTGTFKAARVNDKVVLELSGFEYYLYIFSFEDSSRAETFLSLINLGEDNEALNIAPDVRLYLETGTTSVSTQNESDQGDPRTLPLANSMGRRSIDDQGSSRNVRSRSDDDRD